MKILRLTLLRVSYFLFHYKLLGWSAQGPPPEPDARVPALKRAACASREYEMRLQPEDFRGERNELLRFFVFLHYVYCLRVFYLYYLLTYLLKFRSQLLRTVLEIKKASEEAKRNYREALKRHMNKE